MEQEPILNEHNKLEYPPMHTDGMDTSLMTNVDDIDVSSLDYKQEVTVSLNEAKNYLSGFDWCLRIIDGWVAASFGYILNVFCFKIQPDNKSCNDEFVWVIVGDIPPAYIDVVSAPTVSDALKTYINIIQDWVDNVNDGNSVEDCFPINVPQERKYAEMLAIRLKLLIEDYLPQIYEEYTQTQ